MNIECGGRIFCSDFLVTQRERERERERERAKYDGEELIIFFSVPSKFERLPLSDVTLERLANSPKQRGVPFIFPTPESRDGMEFEEIISP